jgi:hypothetical protein
MNILNLQTLCQSARGCWGRCWKSLGIREAIVVFHREISLRLLFLRCCHGKF